MKADSQTLLADYAKGGSEAAFRELVARYLDLVYSTAVRLAGGDSHLAEDVAQTVFVDLARLAKHLSGEVRLGGWLHRHTCFVAAKTLRGERRRQIREKQAAAMNAPNDHSEARLAEVAPILDEAINQLGAMDRQAVLLRFYEQLDFCSVGQALGTNEVAAQKRVSRALEKLHALLRRRGVALSIAALASALTVEAVKAAPAGLASSIAGSVVAGAAAGTAGNIFTLVKFMASTKLKTSVLVAVIVASVLTPLLLQRQAQARLREQDETWRQQSDQAAQLSSENQRLGELAAQARKTEPSSDAQFRELLRLRGEVGRLKGIVQKMTMAKTGLPLSPEEQIAALKQMYAARVEKLKQWLEANSSERIPELQFLTDEDWLSAVEQLGEDATEDNYKRALSIMRSNAESPFFDKLRAALKKYVGDNAGQFPEDLSQLGPYLSSPIEAAILQRYEIVPSSSLVNELQSAGNVVITEAAPVNPDWDGRRACGLNDMRTADDRISNRWTYIPSP